MAPLNCSQIAAVFLTAATNRIVKDIWLSDRSWVEYLSTTFSMVDLSICIFNTALSKNFLLHSCFTSSPTTSNELGIFRIKRRLIVDNIHKRVNFYYISSNKNALEPRPLPNDNGWLDIYSDNKIYVLRSTAVVTPTNDDDTMSTSSSSEQSHSDNELAYRNNLDEVRKNLVITIGDYFNSKLARNLFCPNADSEESISDILERRIELLAKMMVSTEVLYKHTNKANKYVPDAQQTLGLTTKCQYLRIAYGTALTLMPQGNYTWKTCCDKAIKELADLVLAKKVINSRAILTYHIQNKIMLLMK
jgi:hypothetical protein